MVAGVCGGLGRALGVDPVIFRITLAVLAVFGGIGLLLYGAGWLLIPEEGTDESEGARLVHGRTTGATLVAIALGLVGLLFVAVLAGARLSHGLPLLLIVAVLAALVAARRPHGSQPLRSPNRGALLIPVVIVAAIVGVIAVVAIAHDFFLQSSDSDVFGYGRGGRAIGTLFILLMIAAVVGAAAVALRTRAGGMTRWWHAPGPTMPSAPTTSMATDTATTPLGPPAGYSPSRPLYQPWTPPPAPPRAPREPSFLVPLTLSVGLVAVGVLLVLGASGQLDVNAADLFAAALLATGLGLTASTWLGRGKALIPVGIILTIGLVLSALVNLPLRGGIGSRNFGTSSVADLQPKYQLGVGKQQIDLHDLRLNGRTVHLAARVGVGQLLIEVPDNVKVVVHAHAGAGQTNVFYVQQSGTNIDHTTSVAANSRPSTTPQAGELDLDVRVGVGDVTVFQEANDDATTAIAQPVPVPEPPSTPQPEVQP